MSVFRCKMCGGTLEINENQTTAVCEYCGTNQTLPKLDDDRRAQMYDRANHFRRNNEFDKAMGIYEKILNEDSTDAEAYWSLVLCRYGVEYVEDPSTHKRVPTVNRTQFTSIFDDEDYKSALQYADGYQKSIYEEEANAINEIQKGILAISQKEDPFDVFICYKETDKNGRRTRDSVLANELYHQLTQEGFKVFFSRITLEDKLGTAYEPYIFAALNSAKVMVVIGTKPEYFNAVWVKNEWSRYLALIKNGAKKVLIPAYRDMDPYDLPDEFSHLQAQDMSKLGFMQDLIRGIKKLTQTDTANPVGKEAAAANEKSNSVAPLLKRAFMYLEDGNWQNADSYFERVLDVDPENAKAYLGKMMAEMQIRRFEELKNPSLNSKAYQEVLQRGPQTFGNNGNYQKALRFADDKLKADLKEIAYELKYQFATNKMLLAQTEKDYAAAATSFWSISNYKDAGKLEAECRKKAEVAHKDPIFAKAEKMAEGGSVFALEQAVKLYQSIPGWKDADERAERCAQKLEKLKKEQQIEAEQHRIAREKLKKKAKKIAAIVTPIVVVVVVFLLLLNPVIIPTVKYNRAVDLLNAGNYSEAAAAFEEVGDYRDARERIHSLYQECASVARTNSTILSAYGMNTMAVKPDGTVVAVGWNDDGQCDVDGWTDIVAVSAGYSFSIGLKSDGTVESNSWYGNERSWTDIVAVATGRDHIIGLKSDGTVVAVGRSGDVQCDVESWTDIVAVAAGYHHIVGVKADGTVVAVGWNNNGQCDVEDWTDIVAVAAGYHHTVGVKADGTVVAVGWNNNGQCDVEDWTDIVAVSAGFDFTVGLKSDGTVVAVGNNEYGQCDVGGWTDIVAVTAGYDHTVGLKSDGTVVAVGSNQYGQCEVKDWQLQRLQLKITMPSD